MQRKRKTLRKSLVFSVGATI